MKKSFVALFLVPLFGCAADASPHRANTDLPTQLLMIEQSILHAYITRDTRELSHHLASEYVHTNLVGQRETKAQELAEFAPGGAFSVRNGSVDHPVAIRYGHVAVLRADVHWIGATYTPAGRPAIDVSGDYSVTRVYVWRSDRWQLAASHASRQPTPQR
jgi:hypothetical protein